MAAYEYDTFTASWGHGGSTDGIKSELNKRGSDGWELVGMSRDESPTDDHDDEVILFVFKRQAKKAKNGKNGKKKKK